MCILHLKHISKTSHIASDHLHLALWLLHWEASLRKIYMSQKDIRNSQPPRVINLLIQVSYFHLPSFLLYTPFLVERKANVISRYIIILLAGGFHLRSAETTKIYYCCHFDVTVLHSVLLMCSPRPPSCIVLATTLRCRLILVLERRKPIQPREVNSLGQGHTVHP